MYPRMSLISHKWNSRNLMKDTGQSILVWMKVWTLHGPVKAEVLSTDALGYRLKSHLPMNGYTNMVCQCSSYKLPALPDGNPLTFIPFFDLTTLFLTTPAARSSCSLETHLWVCLWCLPRQTKVLQPQLTNPQGWLAGEPCRGRLICNCISLCERADGKSWCFG